MDSIPTGEGSSHLHALPGCFTRVDMRKYWTYSFDVGPLSSNLCNAVLNLAYKLW
jgi:hypothetical protein